MSEDMENEEEDFDHYEDEEKLLKKRKEAKEEDVDANLPSASLEMKTMLDEEFRELEASQRTSRG